MQLAIGAFFIAQMNIIAQTWKDVTGPEVHLRMVVLSSMLWVGSAFLMAMFATMYRTFRISKIWPTGWFISLVIAASFFVWGGFAFLDGASKATGNQLDAAERQAIVRGEIRDRVDRMIDELTHSVDSLRAAVEALQAQERRPAGQNGRPGGSSGDDPAAQ